jgi:tRNA pseudouridine38-40 synthase
MKLFLKIAFLGTNYCGYQVQNNAPTVQQVLNEASYRIFGFDCDIVGCSRTDSGVHANEFCATVAKKGTNELITGISIEKIPLAFSAHLPRDICVFDAAWVSDDFHARFDAQKRTYLYRIQNTAFPPVLNKNRVWHVNQKLDIKKMNQAAQMLIGKHDFSTFRAANCQAKSPYH